MSILAKLLKRTEPSQPKGDIPPGVVQAVNGAAARDSGSQKVDRKKFLLVGVLVALLVAGGALLVLYLKLNAPVRPMPKTEPVIAKAPMPEALQKPLSTAVTPPVEPVRRKEKIRLTRFASTVKRTTPVAPAPQRQQPGEKKVAPKDRATIDAYLFTARNAEAKGDYLLALKSYQKALDADPGNYKIMNNVASAMLHLGMYREALAMVQQILAIKPEYVSAMVNGGIARYRLGLLSDARQWFEKAVATDPSHREALYNLALSQEKSGALDDALASYRRLSGGGDPQGTLGVARILEWQQDKPEALRLYREILALPEAGRQVKEAARERVRALDR